MKYEYEVILKEQAKSIYVTGTHIQENENWVHIYDGREIVAYIYKVDLSLIKSRKIEE